MERTVWFFILTGHLPQLYNSFFMSTFGELTPDDPFVFVGVNVTLECRLSEKSPCLDSKNLYLTRHGEPLDRYVEVVDDLTVRLTYPVTGPDDGGHFVCRCRIGGENHVVDSQHVSVDYPPGKLRKVTCIAANWVNMTCTWDLPHRYVHPENLSVNVSLRTNPKGKTCCEPRQRNLTSCTWTEEGSDFVWGHQYWLSGQVVYSRDGVSFKKTGRFPIRTRHIVKPSPVVQPSDYNITTSSIRVRLYHTDNHHAKVAIVQYSSQWNPDKWLEKNTTWPKWKPVDVEIEGLQPWTVYKLRAAVRPAGMGYVSDWRFFTERTLPSVPEVAPALCSGCYTELPCDTPSCRDIRLFWKSIPPFLRNSEIKGYHLELTTLPTNWISQAPDLTTGHRECRRREEMELIPHTSHVLTVSRDVDSVVQLYAVTSQDRLSGNCSLLFIPSLHSKPDSPEELIVEVDDYRSERSWNGQFYLRWSDAGMETASFLVVWCQGYLTTHSCRQGEDIQWQQVSGSQKQLNISAVGRYGAHPSPHNFIIGVSRQQLRHQDQDDISSSISWASCLFIHHKAPRAMPAIGGLTPTDSGLGLHLTWTFKPCGHRHGDVYVSHFVIYYCIFPRSHNTTCQGREETVTVGGRERRARLRGLRAGQEYRVRMAAASPWGEGPLTTPVYSPVSNNGSTDAGDFGIVAVVFSIVVLLICVCGSLWCILHKKYRKNSQKFAPTLTTKELYSAVSQKKECKGPRAGSVATDSGLFATAHSLSVSTTHLSGHADSASRRQVPTTQVSVNSETPLLTPDAIGEEEEEEDSSARHANSYSSPSETTRMLTQAQVSQDSEKSSSTQGSDSGVECRHSGGDLEEAPGVDSAGSAEDPQPEDLKASQSWLVVTNTERSLTRAGNVSEGQPVATVSPVGTQHEAGQAGTVPSDGLFGEMCPQHRPPPQHSQAYVSREEPATPGPSAAQLAVSLTEDTLDDLESGDSPRESLYDLSSQLVLEGGADVQPSGSESSVPGDAGTAMSSTLTGQEMPQNAYVTRVPDALGTVSEVGMRTRRSFSDAEDLSELSEDPDFTEACSDSDGTEGISVENPSKDAGGRAFVHPHPCTPCPSHLLPLSSYVHSCGIIREPVDAMDTANGYVAPDSKSPPVNVYVAPDSKSPPVNGYLARDSESPAVNEYVTRDSESPAVNEYVTRDSESPPVQGNTGYTSESPPMRG